MIFFVAPADETWEMEDYLQQYGSNLLNRITLITYDDIASGKTLPVGTYVFSAIDRLFPCEKEIAARFCRKLLSASSHVTLLNDPGRVVCRYQMLKECFLPKSRFAKYIAKMPTSCSLLRRHCHLLVRSQKKFIFFTAIVFIYCWMFQMSIEQF